VHRALIQKKRDKSDRNSIIPARRLGLVAILSFFLLIPRVALGNSPGRSGLSPRQSSTTAVATDRYFQFHSGFWINLHLFLLEEAVTRVGGREIGREAELTSDSAISATLTGTEKTNWDNAVAYYQTKLIGLDLVTNDRMRIIKNTLENFEDQSSLRLSHLDPQLVRLLNNAAPVYRAHWWPAHDRANRAWIAAVAPLIHADGNTLTQKISAAYETPWPADPLRVDVVAYADASGSFATLLPTRLAISSLDPGNQKLSAEEVLFHESSHALAEKVANMLFADFAADRRKAPRELLDAILSYTASYFVGQAHSDDISYAGGNALSQPADWAGFDAAIKQDWQPHLEGRSSAREAVARVVSDIVAASREFSAH
jgi:hypothetical protein